MLLFTCVLLVSKVCRSRGDHQVVNADCRVSPFRDGIADAVISIAVIHHLATEERRRLALQDISRKLAELPSFTAQHNFVNTCVSRITVKRRSSSGVRLG